CFQCDWTGGRRWGCCRIRIRRGVLLTFALRWTLRRRCCCSSTSRQPAEHERKREEGFDNCSASTICIALIKDRAAVLRQNVIRQFRWLANAIRNLEFQDRWR